MTTTIDESPPTHLMSLRGDIICWRADDLSGDGRPRLAVKTPFSKKDNLDRHMPRGRWHREYKVWSWPLTIKSCRRLRLALGDDLRVHESVAKWYTDAMRAQSEREVELARKQAEVAEKAQLDAERAVYGESHSDDTVGSVVPPELEPDESDNLDSSRDKKRARRSILLPEAVEVDRWPLASCDSIEEWPWISGFSSGDPRGKMQTSGAGFLLRNGSGIVADEVGLGKTLLCILAATSCDAATKAPILVVAPKKVARNTWPAEIARWSPGSTVLDWPIGASGAHAKARRQDAIRQAGLIAKRGRFASPVFLVVNHDALRTHPDLLDVEWSSVVVDEAHLVLSVGHRGEGKDTRTAAAMSLLRTHPDGLRVACTGTPFSGKLANMWGLVDWCHPGAAGPSRNSFAREATEPARDDSQVGRSVSLDRVRSGMESLWSEFMSDWVLRRHRIDLFPEQAGMLIRHDPIIVEPTEAQIAMDRAWRSRPLWSGRKGDVPGYTRQGSVMVADDGTVLPDVIVAVGRRLQLAVGEMTGLDDESLKSAAEARYRPEGLPKVDKVASMLKAWGLNNEQWWLDAGEHGKVVVASPWTTSLDALQARLEGEFPEGSFVRVDGKLSEKVVSESIDRFRAPRGPSVMLLSSKSGGAGLTLDEHCCKMIFLAEDWVEDTQTQAMGRIANRTWVTIREFYSIRTRGMLDAYLDRRTLHQRETQASIMELARMGD